MKINRLAFGVLVFVVLISFAIAESTPNIEVGEDYNKIQKRLNSLPVDESGSIDYSKVDTFRSKAGERIDAINLWVENNASWLEIVFGMVPAVSFLFFFNIYLWLLFFTIFVLNGNLFGLTWGILNKEISLGPLRLNVGRILGIGVFIFLLVSGLILKIANFVYGLWMFIWDYGWIIALFVFVLIIILAIYFPMALRTIAGLLTRRHSKRRDSLNKGANKSNKEDIALLSQKVDYMMAKENVENSEETI